MAKLSKSELGKRLQSGQALLIVLLGMAVVLTMVLSVVSRSVTDIQLTTRDDEALRAFSAAEAGVEQALIVGTNIGDTSLSDAGSSYSVSVEELGTSDSKYAYPEELYSGESATLWLVSHDEDGNLSCSGADNPCYKEDSFQVCWGKDGTKRDYSAPALEVSVYYDADPTDAPFATGANPDFGDVQVARRTYDPTAARKLENSFEAGASDGNCDFGDNIIKFEASFNLAALLPANCSSTDGCLLFAKAKLIYNNTPHPVGFLAPGSATFPSQGVQIESTGQFGDSTRQIEVFRTYSEPLSIFESAIFSMGGDGDLTK